MNDLATRPKSVVIASVAVALSYFTTLLSYIRENGFPQYWTSYALLVGFAVIYLGLASGIYKRSRIARWLLIGWSVLSLIFFPIALLTYTTGTERLTASAQIILWATALAMLLTGPAKVWFRKA